MKNGEDDGNEEDAGTQGKFGRREDESERVSKKMRRLNVIKLITLNIWLWPCAAGRWWAENYATTAVRQPGTEVRGLRTALARRVQCVWPTTRGARMDDSGRAWRVRPAACLGLYTDRWGRLVPRGCPANV